MAKPNEILNETAERELVITRIFDAPRELVFKAWADLKHLIHWRDLRDLQIPFTG